MSGNGFDQITQEVLKQKQLMEQLQAENLELREQLADLRSGRGIFVDLPGIRFALRDDSSVLQTTSTSSAPASASPLTPTDTTSATPVFNQSMAETPTTRIAEVTSQSQEQSIPEEVSPITNDRDQKSTSGEPTFLEEIMIDEFANNPLPSSKAVWQDPTEKKQSTPLRKPEKPINEEQKEDLRRALMNSFLLE